MKHLLVNVVVLVTISAMTIVMAHAQWETTSGPNSGPIMVVDTTLYAGAGSPSTFWRYSSASNGWTQLGSGIANTSGLQNIGHLGSNFFFAGCAIGGVYTSTNNGVDWTHTSLNNFDITAMTAIGDSLFAALVGGFEVSADSGKTWSSERLEWPSASVHSFLNTDNGLFAVTENNVYFSADHGATWAERDSSIKNMAITEIFAHGGDLYAGSQGHGVFRSSDNGVTWTSINTGIDLTASFGYVFNFAVSGARMFAAAHAATYVSTDGGDHWSNLGATGFNDSFGPRLVAVIPGYLIGQTGALGPNRLSLDAILGVGRGETLPRTASLGQNYPNPFNPSTSITYTLSSSNFVTLKVYAISGQEVATLVNEREEAGARTVRFNMNSGAKSISSGLYYYRLEAGAFTATKKMMLVK